MAEEKKTTTKKSSTTKSTSAKSTTPKKTTTPKKKEVVEEVKVEKRFCTKCGRELNEGETCTCETVSTKASTNVNTDEIINSCKNFLDIVINMFKKPATTLKEEVSKNNVKSALIMLAVIAVTYGLYIMGAFTSIVSMINGYAGGDINELVEIPYLKIFIYMTLIYFLISFIPIAVTYVVGRITGNRDFDFKKSISLYAYSNAPIVFANILMALLYWLDILSWIGVIIGCVVSIACFFNYILGYLNITNINEDKKAYALSAVIISWVVIAVIAIVIFAGSLISDISQGFNLKNNSNNYNDYYNG